MSSMYPPYGDASARRCQRCGRPLAPSEVYCGTCGEYNFLTSTNGATERAQPPGAPWGGSAPQTFYGGGQPAAPPGPNTFLRGNFAPPRRSNSQSIPATPMERLSNLSTLHSLRPQWWDFSKATKTATIPWVFISLLRGNVSRKLA